MVNRRGFLRLIEAIIAIMIILGVVLFMSVRNSGGDELDLTENIAPYLDEIAKDSVLRKEIIENKIGTTAVSDAQVEEDIRIFIGKRITNPLIGFDVRLCTPPDEPCALVPYPSGASQGLFAGERIISSTIPQYSPKKLKVFLWIED